ncbi:MAG: hypothetical protein ISS19_15170 [Bacteroidales bacterium]|nr:hypothetical protein [Bacteroidales bacterium]
MSLGLSGDKYVVFMSFTSIDNYIYDQATEEVVYNMKNPDFLHIATHGFWTPTLEESTPGFRIINSMMNSGL